MLFPFPTIQPVANRLLAERWDRKKFENHQTSLKNARPSVDNSCPMYFGERKKTNMKKIQLKKDQQAEIDHRNRLLLSKFKQVAAATAKAYTCESSLIGLKETLCDRQQAKRIQQLEIIDRENKNFLTRLEGVTPTYRASNWHSDRIQTLHYLANVSHHKGKYLKEMEALQQYQQTKNKKTSSSSTPSSPTVKHESSSMGLTSEQKEQEQEHEQEDIEGNKESTSSSS